MSSHYKHTHSKIIKQWLKDTSQTIEMKKENGEFEQVYPNFIIMDMNINTYRLRKYKPMSIEFLSDKLMNNTGEL